MIDLLPNTFKLFGSLVFYLRFVLFIPDDGDNQNKDEDNTIIIAVILSLGISTIILVVCMVARERLVMFNLFLKVEKMYYDCVRLYFATDLDCIKFVSEFVFVIRVSHELLAIIAITFCPLSLTYYIVCASLLKLHAPKLCLQLSLQTFLILVFMCGSAEIFKTGVSSMKYYLMKPVNTFNLISWHV